VSLAIRAATPDDEAAVLALVEELFAPPGSRPSDYTPARGAEGFRDAVGAADADVLLAVADGAVLGFASVYADIRSIRFGPRCWVEDLVVTAPARSAGVGGRLLDAASAWGRARGCTHLELDSAPARRDAHRFYLAQGLAQTALGFSRRLA
jgi:GNAT superfamily N-acetyltransferase